ncbi:MAG: hypothetical protein KKE24_05855 [Candidatus Thermoplasmatota archaeon]|nr:hypothetical protein [Candidatus Thermoplasmatota archaeon]
MAMLAKTGAAYSIIGLLVIGMFLCVLQPAEATSGSITVNPGETKYVSFGTCVDNDVLLWSLEISTWSTIFTYWLQKPDGGHLTLESLTWGKVVNYPGEWKLGFSIDSSGWWSATLYYTTYRVTPSIVISTPHDSSYINQAQIDVSGTVDGYADAVAVSLDDIHYDTADIYLGSWSRQVTLTADGDHTIYAEATLNWGSYAVKYYDSVTVTLDRVLPEVNIVVPSDSGLVRDNYVDISWQCSDECGIAKTEMKIDSWGWSTVTGSSYNDFRLSTGEHTIQIRVTDMAGNQATDSTTFTVDARALSFDGPYYGLPLVGIVLGIVIVAITLVLLLRRRRGGAAIATAPEETSPESAQ